MAESTGNEGSNGSPGGWWGNFLSSAKTKSAEVFEFMKRDFDEISSAVKSEAATIATQTASAVKETLQLDKEESAASSVKRSVSSFFDSMKEALSPSPSSEFDEALVIHQGNPVAMTKLQKKIHSLVTDDSTYVEAISESDEGQFQAWLGVVEENLNCVDRLTHLLEVNPTLQDKYNLLVPDQVSHTDFWQRYLFKKAVLEDREAETERKLERERKQAERFAWDKEDLLGAEIELTEEEQIRLLAEYDQERNGRPNADLTKNSSSSNLQDQGESCITVKEKRDLVIVTTSGGNDISQASSSSKASTDGDWEKEFDIEENDIQAPVETAKEAK